MNNLRYLVRRYLAAAWRYRWPAVLFAWLICAVGWTLTFFIPNIYQSNARLYVDTNAVLTPLLNGIAVDSNPYAQLEMLQRTLLSRPNLETLISKTDLDLQVHNAAERDAMVAALSHSIIVTPQSSNLFSITYRSTSPKLAEQVVQTVLNIFIESKTGNNRADMATAAKFLDEQIADYKRQLQAVERRIADFRSKYVDLLPGADGGASHLEGARASVMNLEGQLQDAMARRNQLAQQLANTPQTLPTETAAAAGSANAAALLAAQQRLDELRLQYTSKSPDVIAAERLVRALRSGKIASAPPVVRGVSRSVPNPLYEQLQVANVNNESVISSLTRQVNEARQERNRLESIARGAPGLEAEFTNMNRNYNVLQKNYQELLARRESMRIARAADTQTDKLKMQVIDPPQVPRVPVAPKRVLMIFGVLVAAVAGGCGLAFVLLTFDQCFHSLEDLRGLGLPVIGGVSLLSVTQSAVRRTTAIAAFGLAALLPAIVCLGLVYRLTVHPNFPV